MSGRHETDSGAAPFQRLIDARGGTPDAEPAWAVDLVRAAPAHQAVPGRKQRLLLRLGRRRRAPSPLLLRFAVVGGLLIGGGAVASAALGYLPRWVAHVYQTIAPARAVATASPQAHHARARSNTVTTAATPAVEEASPTLVVAPTPPVIAAKTRPSRVVPNAAGRTDDDPSLVMRGMRALRREGDPGRARALAGRYLQSYPNGSLAEEALALAIEAALARGDADAVTLGRRYLQLYPRGPFRDVAIRATSPGSGAPRP